jgi:hypothetical protein
MKIETKAEGGGFYVIKYSYTIYTQTTDYHESAVLFEQREGHSQ